MSTTLSPSAGGRSLSPGSSAVPGHGASMTATLVNGTSVLLASGGRTVSNPKQAALIGMEIQRMRQEADDPPQEGDSEFEEEQQYTEHSREYGSRSKLALSASGGGSRLQIQKSRNPGSVEAYANEHEGVYDPDGDVPKNITWADDHGYALFEVYYSDRLHYSMNSGYEDSPNPGHCCVIM